MRLVCLECSAVYEAPDNLFGPQPREVRCNRCSYQWTVIGSLADESTAALSAGPAETPAPAALTPEIPPPPAPMPVAPVPVVPEPPTAAMPIHPEPPASHGASRLADSLAGPLPPAAPPPLPPAMEPPPVPLAEPAAPSTRTLLAGSPAADPGRAAPDPEERRLSHELDFGEADRRRSSEEKGAARRAALLLVVLLIVIIIAAVLFKQQVVAALPQAKAVYTAVGL